MLGEDGDQGGLDIKSFSLSLSFSLSRRSEPWMGSTGSAMSPVNPQHVQASLEMKKE